jgi:hypothetical protein
MPLVEGSAMDTGASLFLHHRDPAAPSGVVVSSART